MELTIPSHPIEQLIVDLQAPAAYPHPVEAVEVIQTHVSCVFLTGDYAYKVKKPVNFGFLDYSTIDRRRYFCEQEVALNRRLCPDIYLEVVPLTLQHGRFQVKDVGTPVEWAVRMRQLEERDMLSTRLADGAAGAAEIRRVAQVLADFHRRAAHGPEIRAFGSPATVERVIGDTLHVMDTVSAGLLPAEAAMNVRRFLEEFQREEADLLFHRMETDRTRDCHGDLRTQNICLDPRFDGGIQVFDCIEFNEAFRYIDVAADLAYLTMDLDLAGRADLRERLTDAYVAACDDANLLRVQPFYLTYRACVRGNIALLAAAEHEIPEPEQQHQREIALAAYDLARCYAGRREAPALFITVGFSGSGKSVLARELCRRLPAVLLSSDRVRKELAGVRADEPLKTAHYTPEKRATIYEELRRRAGECLARGEHVLLDATFLAEQERVATAALAKRWGAEFWMLECQCPDAVIRQRIRARHGKSNASDAGIAVYEEQRRSYAPITPPDLPGLTSAVHIPVDTHQAVSDAARMVVDRFVRYDRHQGGSGGNIP